MYNIKAFLNDISINKMCVLLEKIQPAKIYNKGDFIFHQEDKADCFYFLKSGAIRTFSTSVNGDERTIFILRKQGVFGTSSFFTNETRRSFVIALSKCEIISIDKEIVNKYISINPNFSLCIIQDLSRDINSLFDQISISTFLDAKQKIAYFIVKSIKNNHCFVKENIFYIYYTQDDIAKILGLSRPTVNKTLSFFKNQNWLETKYSYISIFNLQAIENFLI
ncbi:Crp/Fnr family transcriptional regulator [Clostridium butyricum]|uniref:Cyclic nucleotide-binding protein n=1 Tax=Clostridium butyricum E4 str. BoNT E BL5262 TaxID=632245 RepID=C4ICI3_CLOBU|nr:Crp/Fnr family transcriptional regulator [Clostridium butyricum]EDT76225.1 putative CRP [Clostridium butyricum 5521]EEP56191.1 cyclic nucleotide-binding protein [Clostridium butyricum E4 str. BoNT E BL5262]NFL33279.1 Crp/Fnr family transcriptional regulator [Clostridium butyricum]NFS16695.1 Crp/Fnr family transcriptional regulator [Clostridium butyricum]